MALRERDERLAEVAGEGGAADLVVHHVQRAALLAQAQHRLHEVVAAGAEQPRGAHDELCGLAVSVARSPASFERPYSDSGLTGSDSTYGLGLVPSKT